MHECSEEVLLKARGTGIFWFLVLFILFLWAVVIVFLWCIGLYIRGGVCLFLSFLGQRGGPTRFTGCHSRVGHRSILCRCRRGRTEGFKRASALRAEGLMHHGFFKWSMDSLNGPSGVWGGASPARPRVQGRPPDSKESVGGCIP